MPVTCILWNCFMFETLTEAGHHLAKQLEAYQRTDAFVLGLARGGEVVAHAVAADLSLPLDTLVIKKISAPGNTELAIGALAPDKISVVNWKLAHAAGVDEYFV